MNPNPNSDKYAKAIIESPYHELPTAFLKANCDPSTGELGYMKIFEEDPKKPERIAEEIAAGSPVTLDRRVYRIRNIELCKVSGHDFEDMKEIHRVSKATIGLLVDAESDRHTHSFLDLVDTVQQVKMAEELIPDKILETYEGMTFLVVLMPPTVYGHQIRIPADQVASLHGENSKTILAMEVVSGASLQCDDQPFAVGAKDERLVNVHGPKVHVFKAVTLINSQLYKPGECLEAEEERDMLFRQLSFVDILECMQPRTCQLVDLLGLAFASGLKLGFGSGSGPGSGQTEEQKEQHAEEAKDKDESEGKKKQQHKEDVKEAVSGEASKPKESDKISSMIKK